MSGKAIKAALPDWLLSDTLKRFALDPRTAVLSVIIGFIANSIVIPLVTAFVRAGGLTIEAIQTLVFGTDHQLGGNGETWGLADFPIEIVDQVVKGAITPIIDPVQAVFVGINLVVIEVVAPEAGLLSPIVVIVWFGFELYAIWWISWRALEMIDIPVIDLPEVLLTVSAPFRAITKKVFGK